MTDGPRPFQALQFGRTENLRNQSHVTVHLESATGTIGRDNPRAFLAAMLEGEEPVVSEDSSIRMAEDGENPALVLRQDR